jgi:hypothetical protein
MEFVFADEERKVVDVIFPPGNYVAVKELCGTCVLPGR